MKCSLCKQTKDPLADAAEGSIHMQIIIDFHSARQSAEQEYGSQIWGRLHLYQSNASARSAEGEGCRAASSHRVLVVTDQPELRQIDQILLKQTHTAATTFILEAVKQNADKSTIR